MPFNITDKQFRVIHQNIQKRFVRIELLNYQFQTVDELSGVVTSGNITIDANSDIRRTGTLSLVVQDSSFEVGSGSKIWLDKYIRVYVDIENVRTGERIPTNCGLFIIDEPKYQYDHQTNTLTLSLLDLMAKLTGARNGYLKGMATQFKAGENIRQAIIDTLALAGFTKYVVEEAPSPSTIPADLEFDMNATVYSMLSALRDIYPNYEIFFDIDGTFYYKPIPTGQDDPVLIDDSTWESIVLSEGLNTDFQNVKNSIEVFGRTHEAQYVSFAPTVSGSVITLRIDGVTAYEPVIYGFTLTDNTGINDIQIKINTLSTLNVKDEDGKNVSIAAESGTVYYCVEYKDGAFKWLGHLQAYALAEDTNPESPFYVEGSVGRIRLPLYGGEYDNCLTDNLAQQRANYELWLHTNMNNTVTLSCIPVPWMDVNILVEYTMQRNNVTNHYLIKSINMGLGVNDTMNIEMIQFYPDSPSI